MKDKAIENKVNQSKANRTSGNKPEIWLPGYMQLVSPVQLYQENKAERSTRLCRRLSEIYVFKHLIKLYHLANVLFAVLFEEFFSFYNNLD